MSLLRRGLILAGLLVLLGSGDVPAQVTQFPYQAVVESDNVLVRSGPGRRYYPTGRLNRDTPLVVHRHDPGGWYMIAPPTDSFSWIPAESVEVNGSTATVIVPTVAVRVGSRFDDGDRDVVARHLSRGDTVDVLEEKIIAGSRLLKITPPRNEYRWVAGSSVSPTNLETRSQRDSNPYAELPSKKSATTDAVQPATYKTRNPASTPDNSQHPINPKPYASLAELDARFSKIISGPSANWSFTDLEKQYRSLKTTTKVLGFGTLIRRRLAAITRYRTRRERLKQINAVTQATDQRDAALRGQRWKQARQRSIQPASHQQPTTPPPTAAKTPTAAATPTATPRTIPRPIPRFTGAGIIRPIGTPHPRLPRYVLVAPDGRLLSFLQAAPGIDLGRHINQPVGLTGPRSFQNQLQADLLIVQSLMHVRLKQ